MYIMIEENPNTAPDERMFSASGKPRPVKQVMVDHPGGGSGWCDITGVYADGSFKPAQAIQVEDSSDGSAWMVFGGDWGLRLRADGQKQEWDIKEPSQWGAAFFVLDSSGDSIRFV